MLHIQKKKKKHTERKHPWTTCLETENAHSSQMVEWLQRRWFCDSEKKMF